MGWIYVNIPLIIVPMSGAWNVCFRYCWHWKKCCLHVIVFDIHIFGTKRFNAYFDDAWVSRDMHCVDWMDTLLLTNLLQCVCIDLTSWTHIYIYSIFICCPWINIYLTVNIHIFVYLRLATLSTEQCWAFAFAAKPCHPTAVTYAK